MSAVSLPVPQTSRPRRQQDQSIQALRGVAVILLVTFHTIGTPNSGLRVAHDSAWTLLGWGLEDIRMPLFALIAGYVYAMAPVAQWRNYLQLMKGKSRRLLLPLITVSSVLYIARCTIPGLNHGDEGLAFWRVFLFRLDQLWFPNYLWFLQSIFIVFAVVGILDISGLLASRARWSIVTVLATVGFVVVHVPAEVDVFSVSGALRLLPFVLLGYGMRRHTLFDLRGAPAVAAAGVAFAGIYAIRLVTIFGTYRPDRYVDKAIAVGLGATAVVLLYSARNVLNTKLLAWLGGFSFGIYLLHIFATGGSRICLEHVGVHRVSELFVAGLLMGIGAPIVFQLIFGKVWFIRTFILGERSTRRHSLRRKSRTDKVSAAVEGVFTQQAPDRCDGQTSQQDVVPLAYLMGYRTVDKVPGEGQYH
jgi:peptidoglycan/LPS O-acetylase OafA/YrhL